MVTDRNSAPFGIAGVLLLIGGCEPPPHTLPRELIPSFDGITVLPQIYFEGATIPNPVLPTALGGDAPLRYTLEPALPPGLTFDAATRVISGTPTETLGPTEFTYTAIDADSDTASLVFTMSVSTISLHADSLELAEWNDPGVAVTVTVSEPPPLAVEVWLDASGTATPGGDYEFDGSPGSDSSEDNADVQVKIAAGADSATTTLESIPDFDEEGSETIDIAVASAAGSRFERPGPSVSLELLDEGAMFADAKERLTSAVLTLFGNFRQTGSAYEFHFSVFNFGAVTTPRTTMIARINFEDLAPGRLLGRPLVSRRFSVPEIPPGAGSGGASACRTGCRFDGGQASTRQPPSSTHPGAITFPGPEDLWTGTRSLYLKVARAPLLARSSIGRCRPVR